MGTHLIVLKSTLFHNLVMAKNSHQQHKDQYRMIWTIEVFYFGGERGLFPCKLYDITITIIEQQVLRNGNLRNGVFYF